MEPRRRKPRYRGNEAVSSGAFGTLPSAMTDGFNLRAGPAGTRAPLEAVKSEFNSSDQGVIAAQCLVREVAID
jgi:hypothetical protein